MPRRGRVYEMKSKTEGPSPICRYILIHRPSLRHWFMSTTLFSIRADYIAVYIYISPFHPSFNPNVRPIDFATKFRRFNGIRIYYESKKRFFVFLFLFFLYRTEFSTLNLCIIYNNFGWDERKNVILYSSSSIHLKRFKGSNWFYSIKRPFIYPS